MNLKPFPFRTLISFSSSSSSSSSSPRLYSLSILVSNFSTFQTQSLPSHSLSRRSEEASRYVKVSVWWDFENCSLPGGANVFKIASTITAALRANGIKGPVQITAFGDIFQLSRANQEALSSTGINLSHVPRGGKNSADRSLLVDLMYWISQNPPPAHLFLISGDRDFASILHKLRMNNYNVLLASSDSAPSVLCSAASIMWNWNALLRGENLTGKHYNQPPDGPYGSWYGHYKVPLEDPYLIEQPTCLQNEELSEGCLDSKTQSVPKAVIKQISQILNSYPEGISITDLRAEISRSKINLPKDLYGYKKFSRFLSSMPHILRLQSEADGQFLIHGITPNVADLSDTSPSMSTASVCRNGEDLTVSSRSSGDDGPLAGALNGKSKLHEFHEVNAGVTPDMVKQTPSGNDKVLKVNTEKSPEEVQQPPSVGQENVEASNSQVTESLQAPILEQDSASKASFFKKVWQRWLGGSNGNSEVKGCDLEKDGESKGSSEKENNSTQKKCTVFPFEREKMKEECKAKSSEVSNPVTVSPSSNDSTVHNKASMKADVKQSGTRSGLLNWIASWYKLWRSSPDSVASSKQSCENHNHITSSSLRHDVFTQDSFWKDMEILMDSPRRSLLVTQSRTREEMAENLLKEGPLVLRSLSNTDLLHLVDLLIIDKKWIEECPSQTFPFRITRAVEKSPALGYSRAANGLRSIFMRTASQENLQQKHEGERILHNAHSGVSYNINKKSSNRSRSLILADCQKLVTEILTEYPYGYNISLFRKNFLEKYGYPLDIEGLGYKRLALLLEIMPGIKIESNYIVPANMVPENLELETAAPKIQESTSRTLGNTACGSPDTSIKGDDFDPKWDELGPISSTSSKKKQLHPVVLGDRRTEDTRTTYPDYEPSLSDDEISDSEGDILTSEQVRQQQKPGIAEEDSSLLQILDSWYSTKESEDRKDNSENFEGMVDCSEYHVKPSNSPEVGMKTETSLENYGKRKRLQKNYSFVADPVGRDKEKLINGILGSLKKSSESRMEA